MKATVPVLLLITLVAWLPSPDLSGMVAMSIRAGVAEVERQAPPGQVRGPVYLNSRITNEVLQQASLDTLNHKALVSALPEKLAARLQPHKELKTVRASRPAGSSFDSRTERFQIAEKGIYLFISQVSSTPDGYDVSVRTKYTSPKTGAAGLNVETMEVMLSLEKRNGQWRVTSQEASTLVH